MNGTTNATIPTVFPSAAISWLDSPRAWFSGLLAIRFSAATEPNRASTIATTAVKNAEIASGWIGEL